MIDDESDAAPVSIGHAIVRSDPWRFQNADGQTRLFFDLPEGDIAGLPLFLPEYLAAPADLPDMIDILIAGAAWEDRTIRAKLLPIVGTEGLFSAIFLSSSTGEISVRTSAKPQDVQHRVSNGLAVIRSIFRRTAQANQDADTLVSHFLGRLDSFSRVQSNVVLYDAYGVTLEELMLDEFMAHAMRTGNRLSVDGPSVRLKTRAAETLSLAIHELATNSIKFGALGSDDGHIDVDWACVQGDDGSALLRLKWTESGVPDVDQNPTHRGFGTDMIENNMAFELGAESKIQFYPDGLHLVIDIPITPQLLHESIDDT